MSKQEKDIQRIIASTNAQDASKEIVELIKQEAIELAKWIDIEGWRLESAPHAKTFGTWFNIDSPNVELHSLNLTSEELYNLFIQSKKNKHQD